MLDAQEAWVIVTDLAHNLLTWSHDWMWMDSPFETWGHLRLVQDVLNIPGYLVFKGTKLEKVALQRDHPFAGEMQDCLVRLFHELSRCWKSRPKFDTVARPPTLRKLTAEAQSTPRKP